MTFRLQEVGYVVFYRVEHCVCVTVIESYLLTLVCMNRTLRVLLRSRHYNDELLVIRSLAACIDQDIRYRGNKQVLSLILGNLISEFGLTQKE